MVPDASWVVCPCESVMVALVSSGATSRLKSSATFEGAALETEPSAGSLPRSAVWARAGTAPATVSSPAPTRAIANARACPHSLALSFRLLDGDREMLEGEAVRHLDGHEGARPQRVVGVPVDDAVGATFVVGGHTSVDVEHQVVARDLAGAWLGDEGGQVLEGLVTVRAAT